MQPDGSVGPALERLERGAPHGTLINSLRMMTNGRSSQVVGRGTAGGLLVEEELISFVFLAIESPMKETKSTRRGL